MGTSKNVASPDTPPWKPALAVLGRNGIPPSRQLREIWRSASVDRGPRLLDDFAAPTLAIACKLAQGSGNVHNVLREYESLLAHDRKLGLAAEIGRRALARAVSSREGSQGFATELFAEATSYYVSRDLPSFVGAKGRVETTTAAMALKSAIKGVTKEVVRSVGTPTTDPDGWVSYVKRVITSLEGGR